METDSLLLTTSQAAGLLGVHESSMKRWANEGRLRLSKTDGGHRRILLEDLLAFARLERSDSPLLLLAPHEHEMAAAALACRERNHYQPLAELIIRLCDTRSPGYLLAVMKYLQVNCGIPLARTFDLGISEAMRRIGNEWASGSRTIAHEHRFTQKMLDAIHALRGVEPSSLQRQSPLALVGCAETCYHEVGAMFVRYLLEEAGWQTCYLGANVPFSEYASIQGDLGARLVAISFVPPCGNPEARRGVGILAGLYRESAPYYLALGGGGLEPGALRSMGSPFLALKVEKDTESFQIWARGKAREKGRAAGKARGNA
ncbi:MAG: helix-turn-helix domain-containing protein [Fibrobacteria bacterium]